MPTVIPNMHSTTTDADTIRRLLRLYIDHLFKECKNIYHTRLPHKDAHRFHLHVPIMLEFEVSSISMYMTTTDKQRQQFVDNIIRLVDKQREELNRVAIRMVQGQHPFPTNRDTVMEFSK